MAMTGLDIFKLLPKTNCKKCGMPTCLAFAMQLAQKKAKLDDCPCASEEARNTLAAAAAPPMKLVKFGTGDKEVKMGQETVLFRHEEKFYNPTVMAVKVSDTLSGDELIKRIEAINALQFERVGLHIGVGAMVVVNDSGDADKFAAAAAAVKENGKLAIILSSGSADAMSAAVAKCADAKPLIAAATADNVDAMAKLAKENSCPIVAKSDTIEGLAELTEKITSQGVEEIVLSLAGLELAEQLRGLTQLRVLSLKKVFRPLGYPTVACACKGSEDEQVAAATALTCKYAGLVVVDTANPAALLSVLTAGMNIYSDPQKPIQVESKIYEIGEPDENSPVLFTTNFSLSYYTVESDVEASRVPCYIIVVDTEGTSVLTAYSGDKLNEKAVADAMKQHGIEDKVKHRKLIIPGYVAVMSGKVEEATGWEVMVGPRESSALPKYLQEVWN